MNKITSLQFLYKHPIWNILFDYQDIKNFYVLNECSILFPF